MTITYFVFFRFKDDVESGLVEIICPPASYYPNFNMLKENLGDSKERTKWRTKQNLDFTYLMMYARTRGTYYVQVMCYCKENGLEIQHHTHFLWKKGKLIFRFPFSLYTCKYNLAMEYV